MTHSFSPVIAASSVFEFASEPVLISSGVGRRGTGTSLSEYASYA